MRSAGGLVVWAAGWLPFALFASGAMGAPSAASSGQRASSVRYALIVGNNHGAAPGASLEDLRHAEREARAVGAKLVELGGFDPLGERTVVVVGSGRAQIIDAAARLAERHRRDRDALGPGFSSLFAFFFTGHGLDEQLLTADDPLTPEDLAGIFRDMDATLTLGVFDACFSGSFDLERLRTKGLISTPGFNPFHALPPETLRAEGTMWLVSSMPDQVSYEDDKLGGVFLHYFLDGMSRARGDGYGITLDEIWEFARQRTEEHTLRTGRPQTPQKMVQRLKASGPIYFAFRQDRSSTLVLDDELSGHFIVRYGRGHVAETFEKPAGVELIVPMYPSDVVIERLPDEGGPGWIATHKLARGHALRVRASDGQRVVGEQPVLLTAKGEEPGVVISDVGPRPTASLDLAYIGGVGTTRGSVPLFGAGLGLRIGAGPAFGRLGLAYGHGEDLEERRFTLDRVDMTYAAGPQLRLFGGRAQLGAELEGLVGGRIVTAAGTSAMGPCLALGLGVNGELRLVEWPVPLSFVARTGVRGEYAAPALPLGAPMTLGAAPYLSVGIAAHVL